MITNVLPPFYGSQCIRIPGFSFIFVCDHLQKKASRDSLKEKRRDCWGTALTSPPLFNQLWDLKESCKLSPTRVLGKSSAANDFGAF